MGESGRGERIRTSDSCVPNAVLYQAELRPEADGGFSFELKPVLRLPGISCCDAVRNFGQPRKPPIVAKLIWNLNPASKKLLRWPSRFRAARLRGCTAGHGCS